MGMKLLIKKATILQPGSSPSAKKDILIENGVIKNISRSISDSKAKIIESKNLHVSPGWLDIGAQCGQPGFEYRETYTSLGKAARAGGYTALATFPRTNPPIHSRLEIEYIQQLNPTVAVKLYPIGAVSQELEGEDLTEIIDMIHAGAVAFSDGRKNPLATSLLTRALEYIIPFDSIIIDFPLDRSVTASGQMHEGNVSASMGLTGIPSVGEEITVQRDVQLVGYTGSRLHFHAISSAASLPIIQRARAEKLRITADVPAMHLLLEDKDVGDFNSHLKVLPPFRTKSDRKAIIKGIKDGTIDHISSIHQPMEVESKECEFTYASFGSIGLETAFAAAHTALRDVMAIEDIVSKFCSGPRNILGVEVPKIAIGEKAELTLFDPDTEWIYAGTKHSLSANDALAGKSFTGKVLGTVMKEDVFVN
jgi:dihydroorotase